MCVRVCMRVSVCECVRACVCMCVCVLVRVRSGNTNMKVLFGHVFVTIACLQRFASSFNKLALFQMGEFDWDKGVQSSILSSFFYGYLVTQIPGGWLAGRFGGKRVLGIGMTIVAIATVLLPVLARQDYRFVYALRVIMGLASVSIIASHI